MKAIEIIAKKVSNEGFAIRQEVLAWMALDRVTRAVDKTFQYGDVVFTVCTDPDDPCVHLYSVGTGACLLTAMTQFMYDVWNEVPHQFLLAPVLNKTVAKFVQRYGWYPIAKTNLGHTIYRIDRRQ